jgi:flagellar biosynthetic protein FliR
MIPINSISLAGLPGMPLQGLFDIFLQVFLVNLRIGAFLISAPFFGSRMVPLQIRIVFSIGLGLFIMSQIEAPDVAVLTSFFVVPLVLQELAIGLCVGLCMTIIFASVGLAGEKIAASSGLSFAMQVDPTGGGQTPVISQILTLFSLVIFFALNGHMLVLALMIESYTLVPIGAPLLYGAMLQTGIDAAGLMFAFAASIMLPIVAVLFIINLAIGIITKSAPQLNLFSFGFPITILSVFVLLVLSVTPLAWSFSDLLEATMAVLKTLIESMPNG